MSWENKETVQKGNIGETIVRSFLLDRNYIPYAPISNKAHPFDNLCASADKKKLFIVEVKTKEARKYYPDTGIDIRHYQEYMYIKNKYGVKVWLFFVDAANKSIYGNSLDKLTKATLINGQDYPLEQKRIIYFPLSLMETITNLSDKQCEEIKKHNTKNYCGAWGFIPKDKTT